MLLLRRLWRHHPKVSKRTILRLWWQGLVIDLLRRAGYRVRVYRIETDDFVWRGWTDDIPCPETNRDLFHAKAPRLFGEYIKRPD